MVSRNLGRVRIFLSSPGDVLAERERAERVIASLSAELKARGEAALDVVRWEDDWYTATADFQAQIARPSDCDLVVSLFWKRLGTELPESYARSDGSARTGSEYEFEEALTGARESPDRVPDILAYRKTAPVFYADETVDLERAQKRALDAFWHRWFHSEEGHFLAGFKTFETTDEFAAMFRRDLERWLAARRSKGAWSIALKGSPFRGLEAFDEAHAPVFFGRRQQVEQARARLVAAAAREAGLPFLLVLGMSGAGKSSLLRAGLVPRFLTPEATPEIPAWRRLVVTPAELGDEPLTGLAGALAAEEALPELAAGDFARPAALAALFEEAPESAARPLLAALDRFAAALASEGGHAEPPATGLLLGLDQFEEIFAWPEQTRRAVLRLLEALAASGRVWIVATLRSDFYPLVQSTPELMRLKELGGSLDLQPPGEAQLAEIIAAPAEAAGLVFERDPATGESLDQRLLRDAGGANPLPLLQFALQALFEERDSESGRLLLARYEAMGGLPGAIERRAEAALRALPRLVQQALPEVIGALADPAEEADAQPDIARRIPLSTFPEGSEARQLIESLVAARLLVVGDGEGGPELRVAHEALFTHWTRAQTLLDASRDERRLRRQIERQARSWEEGDRSEDDLLRGGRLEQARDLAARRPGDLGDAEAFVAASAAAVERGRRRGRRRVAGVIGILVLLLVAAVAAAIYAFRQEELAETRRAEAEESRDVAVQSVDAVLSLIADDLWNVAGVSRDKVLELLESVEARLDRLLPESEDLSASLLNIRASLGHYLARAYLQVREIDAAREQAETALIDARRLAELAPDYIDWRREMVIALDMLGYLALVDGDPETALGYVEEVLAINRERVAGAPDDPQMLRDLMVSLIRVGDVRLELERIEQALEAYEEAAAVVRPLSERYPENADWKRHLALILDRLGDVQSSLGEMSAARDTYAEGIALRRALLEIDPENALWESDLAIGLMLFADALSALGDHPGAQAALEEAVEHWRQLLTLDEGNADWRRQLLVVQLKLGDALREAGEDEAALKAFEEALEHSRWLTERGETHSLWRRDRIASALRVAETRAALGDEPGALAAYEEALLWQRALVADFPGEPQYRSKLAEMLLVVGIGRSDRALLEEGLAILRALDEEGALGPDGEALMERYEAALAD